MRVVPALCFVLATAVVGVGCGDDVIGTAGMGTPDVSGPRGAGEGEGEGAPTEGEGEGEGEGDAAANNAPPFPLVLVHGFSGWSSSGAVDYFFGVVDDLRAAGFDVTAPALPPYATSHARAVALAAAVDDVLARTGKQKVHVIAHSQGGVDARVLVTELGYGDRVASVTTVATPHRGTPVADVAEQSPDGLLNGAGAALGWLIGAVNDDGAQGDAAVAAAVSDMRVDTRSHYTATHPWPAAIPVFSVAGVSNLLSLDRAPCTDALWPASDRVDDVDVLFSASGALVSYGGEATLFNPRANDGLIPVDSAVDGVFLGCVPADHIDEIGQVADITPPLLSGFDHKALYRTLAANARATE